MALSAKVMVQGDASDSEGLSFPIATRVHVRAAASRLFEVAIEVHHPDPALDLEEIIGRNAFVDFVDEPFLKKMDGIVREARQLTAEPGFVSVYELVVVPPHWLLTRRRDCRIFQKLTVPEIVSSVLKGYGTRLWGSPIVSTLDAPPAREYCVQYEETDHDFVFRILAEEGLTWFFDHHQGTGAAGELRADETDDALIVDDTRSLRRHCSVVYNPSANLSTSASQAAGRTTPEVFHVEIAAGVQTARVTLSDYNYETPMLVLRQSAAAKGPASSEAELEAHDYEVGRFREEQPGRAAAERDLQAARAGRRTYRCKTSFLLAPGTRFQIKQSPWGDLDLLVIEMESSALFRQSTSTSHVEHTLVCIPADVPFRPQRRPKPRIYGTQTAFVVGKEQGKDEIDVDAMGRVKVHFNWDRRRTSFEGQPTRFIRVSQPWAGQGHGMTLVPRVGDELVVAFLDGDPDEPIVVGRVHNPVYVDPLQFTDPDQHTVSIWKSKSSPRDPDSDEDRYNLVMMQDKSGQELLKLRAQRDFEHDTLHDSRTDVGHNQTIRVTGSQSTSAGSVSISSGSFITETAATRFSMDAGTSMSLHAAEGLTEVSDTTIAVAAGTTMGLSAGSSLTLGAGTKLEATGPTVRIIGDGTCTVEGGFLYLNAKNAALLDSKGAVLIKGVGLVKIEATGSLKLVASGPVDVEGAVVNVKGGEVNLNC